MCIGLNIANSLVFTNGFSEYSKLNVYCSLLLLSLPICCANTYKILDLNTIVEVLLETNHHFNFYIDVNHFNIAASQVTFRPSRWLNQL